MSFNSGEMVGNYRILEQLGQGGMATVFKAYHAALDRYVALKVLHPALLEDKNFLTRFQREARVVAKLEHPNIVPVYDFADHEGQPYLVMKFIEGETLKARLQGGRLSPDEISHIVEAVGDALSYAHRQGILHRDIKPSNVMIANDGHVYLADFGLARIAQAGESTLTSDMIVGTPQYISPEQAVGKKDLDEGTDIYSFGVMLYELVVGRVPFSADTPYAVIHDHIYSPLPLPSVVNPSVAPDLERVLLKALAKERNDRFKDIPEIVRAFSEAWDVQIANLLAARERISTPEAETVPPAVKELTGLSTVEVEPEPESPPKPASIPALNAMKKSKRRLRWLWIPLGGLLLATLAGIVFLSLRQNPAESVFPTNGTTQLFKVPTNTSALPTKIPASLTPSYPPGVLFQANFDDNQQPRNWRQEQGWMVKDGMLCGSGHSFAQSSEDDWKDYAASFRLKVDQGYLHLNLRHTQADVWKRYIIGLGPGMGLGLHKQINDQEFKENLARQDYDFEPGKWYEVQLVAQGGRILVLVDGVVQLDYVDPDGLPAGGVSFETLGESSACIDGLVVTDLSGKPPFDLLYGQDFEANTSILNWSMMDAAGNPNDAWKLQEGALCGSGHNWAFFTNKSFTDFDTRFRLFIKDGSLHVNFRLHDQPSWRYRIWMGTSDNEVNLVKSHVEKEKLLITGRAAILRGKWYDVRVSLIGGRIQLWINDKRVFDVTDNDPLGGGAIGFETLDDARNVCIDDLFITKPSLAHAP